MNEMDIRIMAVILSYRTAPVHIRELTAFTTTKQLAYAGELTNNIAEECVWISTCNRTEIYLATENGVLDRNKVTEYFNKLIGTNISGYMVFLNDEIAVNHLFRLAVGLDSMVIGEDQILGQVKVAHENAVSSKLCGSVLNTLFRNAITYAKKVKTETLLSKTSVSVATLAVSSLVRNVNGSNILLIGASGKTGGTVLKNLEDQKKKFHIFVTSRNRQPIPKTNYNNGITIIDYNDRYSYIKDMDGIISATSSPHCVIDCNRIKDILNDGRHRTFIDLAVPKDIQPFENENCCYLNIDDFEKIAYLNNSKKTEEIRKAEIIIEDGIREFMNWKLFTENRYLLKDTDTATKKLIYRIRDTETNQEFKRIIELLKKELLI